MFMLYGPDGAQYRVEFEIFVHLGLLAYAGGVDQHEFVAELVVVCFYAVAGGAGDGGDYVPFLAEQGVGEGRLAHIGLSDYGHPGQTGVRVGLVLLFGKGLNNRVHEVAGAAAVGRGDAEHLAEAQAVELIGVVHLFAGIHLVYAQDNGLLAPAEHVRDSGVVVGHSGAGLHHEDDYVGFIDGNGHLTAYGGFENVFGTNCIAPGVNDREFPAVPVGPAVMAVAGHSGGVVDYCLPHAYETVEKGALAHVGAAYYGY